MTESALSTVEGGAPPDLREIKAVAASIDLGDQSLTLKYGAETMADISRFADDLLARVSARDAGEVGEALTELLLKVRGADPSALNEEGGFLERLPLIGSLFNSAQRAMARFNTMAEQVEEIGARLDQAMLALLKDIEMLEELYGLNRNFHEQLSLYIEAGKLKLEEARNVELPRLQKEAEQSGQAMDAQKVRDLAESINRFDRRLHDLQLSRAITLQSAPQIRLIQSNDQTLAEKIQTSVLSTIPLWKGQMVLALSLHGQKGAARLQKEVSDTTNAILRKNAEMLESATVETAREAERPAVDIETLREVQNRLVSSIEQTLQIAREGRDKRRAAEEELARMEDDLRARLTSLAVAGREQALERASGGALEGESQAPALPSTDDGQEKK